MKYFEYFLTAIFLQSLIACNSSEFDKCSVDFSTIYNDKKELFTESGKPDVSRTMLNDKGVNNGQIGGEYIFYENGKIKQYRFFKSSDNYSYAEYYNSDGLLVTEEGDPILTTNIDEISRDSMRYNFYIFNLNKRILSFSIKINEMSWTPINGKEDSIFSNVVRFEYLLNASKYKSIRVIEKLEYIECNGEKKKSVDSSFVVRRQ